MNPLKAGKAILKAKKFESDMKALRATGYSENKRVKITVNGVHEIVDFEVVDELMDPSKKELLKKAIISAHKEAAKLLEKESQKLMQENAESIQEMMKMLGR